MLLTSHWRHSVHPPTTFLHGVCPKNTYLETNQVQEGWIHSTCRIFLRKVGKINQMGFIKEAEMLLAIATNLMSFFSRKIEDC